MSHLFLCFKAAYHLYTSQYIKQRKRQNVIKKIILGTLSEPIFSKQRTKTGSLVSSSQSNVKTLLVKKQGFFNQPKWVNVVSNGCSLTFKRLDLIIFQELLLEYHLVVLVFCCLPLVSWPTWNSECSWSYLVFNLVQRTFQLERISVLFLIPVAPS